MEILVVSKTHKGKAACVGGILLSTNESVRLLNPGNWDQYSDTDLNVGTIWDIDFIRRTDVITPHIEDIIIQNKRFVRSETDIPSFVKQKGIRVYNGSPSNIFDGKLRWTGTGGGFISQSNLPQNSVGFWISDKDLNLNGKHYIYPASNRFERDKKIPYVGFQEAADKIPSGTLIRVSLARWWKPDDSDIEERCYLQLSGWYGYNPPKKASSYTDDLPF